MIEYLQEVAEAGFNMMLSAEEASALWEEYEDFVEESTAEYRTDLIYRILEDYFAPSDSSIAQVILDVATAHNISITAGELAELVREEGEHLEGQIAQYTEDVIIDALAGFLN